MRRSRRRVRRRIIGAAVVLIGLTAGAGGWRYFRGSWSLPGLPGSARAANGARSEPARSKTDLPLIIDASELALAPRAAGSEAPASADEVLEPRHSSPVTLSMLAQPEEDRPEAEPSASPATQEARSGHPAIEAARQQYAGGKILEARHALNALLQQNLPRPEQAEIRKLLTTIADDTIFSKRRLPDDPLTDTYVVKGGDRLVLIGRDYKVAAEGLMRINGIKDATKLRADERIKVVRGPFHAKIYKSEFRMHLFLQDLYVRSFRVGLGADQGTPEGAWKVKERLDNPTYYPPPSAETKRIIAADDPQNPLGEFWIGLEGVSGDAAGRYGYGIHGTIEPDSIGKTVSLGCVRMYNEDVAILYALVLPGESTVTVLP